MPSSSMPAAPAHTTLDTASDVTLATGYNPASRGGEASEKREESKDAPVIVIAPDSFKGSLGAADVAAAIAAGIRRVKPHAVIRECPMADGGEGTLDALLSGEASRIEACVSNAAGDQRRAPLALLSDGVAAIESAEIVGITDPAGMAMPVAQRATQGIGEAILALLARADTDATDASNSPDAPIKRIYVALGGSSTNDGGAGMLVALGAKLLDETGTIVPPYPAAFERLSRIDLSGLDGRLASLELVAMSDVDNPLCGEHGATAIFGPQKGVLPDQIAELDQALSHFADCLEAAAGRTCRDLPGAGAAGGLGYALLMLGAQFRPGAEVVADQIKLNEALEGAHWMISGEGRSDAQTLRGKAPFVACRRARQANVPTTLLSGAVDSASLPALGQYFAGCISITAGPVTLDTAMREAPRLLTDAAEQLTRLRFAC